MEVEFPGKTSAHTAGSPPPVEYQVRSFNVRQDFGQRQQGLRSFCGRKILIDWRDDELRLASFCRKTQNSPSNQAFVQIFSDFCIFPLTCICVLWHIYPHENSLSGVPCRGLELVSESSQKPRARSAGLPQLATHALYSTALPRLCVRRATCQLRPVRPAEEATVRRVCSRRTRAGSASLPGSRACSAGTALPGRTSLCPSPETRAGPVERIKGRRHVQAYPAADQFRRLGAPAAGHRAGTGAARHLRFPGRSRRDGRGRTAGFGTRPEETRDRSHGIDSLADATFPDPDARQELGLSRDRKS